MQPLVLEIQDLQTYFRVSSGINKALDRISLTIREGEILCIVGRSGSGKSVLARSIMGLVRDPGYIAGGSIRFRDQELVGMPDAKLNALRGKDIALIVSSPRSRLNPLLSVGTQLENVVLSRTSMSRRAAHERVVELLTSVSIADPKRVAGLLPQELSGGMCQRVVIAMALSHSPRLLLADEPTAGLDVTVQRQVLELMLKLVRDTGSALLLMTRDLGIVAHYCERVAVLMDGHIVEEQPVRDFFKHPKHPHSAFLLQVAFASHGESEAG
jgi:peptide/nickel transport system ATP-binding protein